MHPSTLTCRGTVYPWHCDHAGHMNVMWYVGKSNEATWALFHEVGLTRAYLSEARRGMAAVEQHIFYLRELHAGSVVSIRSAITEVGDQLIAFKHEMVNDEAGEVAARTAIQGLHLDTQRRKACPFEPRILESARVLAALHAVP